MFEVVVQNPQASRYIAPQVGINRIRDTYEIFEHLAPGAAGHIEAQAAFIAIKRFEKQAVLVLLERRHITADVAAGARVFNFNDIGAHIGQVEGAEGACPVLLDGDDADVFQRTHDLPF